jgi:hypothetical protein
VHLVEIKEARMQGVESLKKVPFQVFGLGTAASPITYASLLLLLLMIIMILILR